MPKLLSYNTPKGVLIGKVKKIQPGSYEVANYTEDGAAHSDIWYSAEDIIEGLVISTEHWQYNVMVQNEDGQDIIILVDREKVIV